MAAMSGPRAITFEPDLAVRAAQSAANGPEKERGDEDEAIDLPPLDDGDDEDEAPEPELDEPLASLEDEGVDPFDDAAASELETGLDVGIVDEGDPREDEGGGDDLDVGALDDGMVIRDSYADDGQERTPGEEDDFEISPDTRGVDDGGAEGTEESAENDVDEADLPGLDADEDGDFEGEDVVREMVFEADSTLPPWDALRWTAVEGAGAPVPCAALAIAAGRVAAGGEVVLVVDDGAHAARQAGFEGGASSVTFTDDGALVVAHGGRLWISNDGGRSADALVGWRGGRGSVDLASTPGRVWILSDGSLWSMPSAGGQAAQTRAKDVRRIAASGPAIVALTMTAAGPVLERLRSDDEGWEATSLTGAAKKAAESEGASLCVASGGRFIAIADRETVCVSRDGGQTFTATELPGTVALAFAGDDAGAPLLALLARDMDGWVCVAMVPAQGEPTRIADVPSGPSDAGDQGDEGDEGSFGAAMMGWDASREVLWIARRSGLSAFARARRH